MNPRPFDFRPDVDYATARPRVIRDYDGEQMYCGFIRDVRGWLAQPVPVIDLPTEAPMKRPRWRDHHLRIEVHGRRYSAEVWYCDIAPAAIRKLDAARSRAIRQDTAP